MHVIIHIAGDESEASASEGEGEAPALSGLINSAFDEHQELADYAISGQLANLLRKAVEVCPCLQLTW